jgi:glycosyltransferase involved in cell wall biosynthesis
VLFTQTKAPRVRVVHGLMRDLIRTPIWKAASRPRRGDSIIQLTEVETAVRDSIATWPSARSGTLPPSAWRPTSWLHYWVTLPFAAHARGDTQDPQTLLDFLFLLTSRQFLCRLQGSAIHIMISLSVPIYNEEGSIEELFEKVRVVMNRNGDPWEIIFVNDGSLDRSEEILNRLATAHREVKVIHFRRNFGQTAALMAGFDFASGDIVVPMDGDGQNDPEDIPRMLAKLSEGYDVCSGWRRDRRDNAIQRNLPSILANKLISAVSGVRLHDFGCSLKAYRAEVLEGIRLYGEMHRFLPIYAKWHGARITEIPVNHFARSCGSSKYGLERVLKVLMDLVTVKFMDRFMLKPMYLFGLWGVAFFAAAFGFSVWTLYMRTKGYFFTGTPLPMMAVFSFMTGVICILMGLLAEMITRTFHESQNKSIYLVRETRNLKSFPKAA